MKLNITGKSSLSSFLEKLCWVFLLAGLTITVALPWILDYYGRIFWHGRLGTDYVRILFVLYPSALMALTVIWQLRKILVNVNQGNPFSLENARRVKIISFCCMMVGLLFLCPRCWRPCWGWPFCFYPLYRWCCRNWSNKLPSIKKKTI